METQRRPSTTERKEYSVDVRVYKLEELRTLPMDTLSAKFYDKEANELRIFIRQGTEGRISDEEGIGVTLKNSVGIGKVGAFLEAKLDTKNFLWQPAVRIDGTELDDRVIALAGVHLIGEGKISGNVILGKNDAHDVPATAGPMTPKTVIEGFETNRLHNADFHDILSVTVKGNPLARGADVGEDRFFFRRDYGDGTLSGFIELGAQIPQSVRVGKEAVVTRGCVLSGEGEIEGKVRVETFRVY